MGQIVFDPLRVPNSVLIAGDEILGQRFVPQSLQIWMKQMNVEVNE